METRRDAIDKYLIDIERLKGDADVTRIATTLLKRMDDLKTSVATAQRLLKSKITVEN